MNIMSLLGDMESHRRWIYMCLVFGCFLLWVAYSMMVEFAVEVDRRLRGRGMH